VYDRQPSATVLNETASEQKAGQVAERFRGVPQMADSARARERIDANWCSRRLRAMEQARGELLHSDHSVERLSAGE
jgi:hypothetical protein